METGISENLKSFLFRTRLCMTLVRISEPARFSGNFSNIVDTNKLPKSCSGLVGVKLSKQADSSFGLWKNCVIFFNPDTREWTGYAEKKENMKRFMVEVVGLIYNYHDYFDSETWDSGSVWHNNPISLTKYDHHIEMDRFGIAISGYNIRTILFKKKYNSLWNGPIHKRSIQEIKGQKLIALLHSILKDKDNFFTKDEMNVIDIYLYQNSLF